MRAGPASRAGRSVPPSGRSRGRARCPRHRRSCRSFSGSEADPRVEHRIEDVGDQGRDEVDHADDHDTALQHDEVLVLGGDVDALADPVVVEQLFDHEQAADQVSHLRRDDGDRRQERVPQHVLVDDLAAGEALQIGGARVVGVDRLDHARASDARDVPEQHHHEREAREQKVLHLLGRVRTRRGCGADREPLEPEAEDEDEDDRCHELRDRGQREARDGDQAVRHPPPPQAGDGAAEDAERYDEDEGDGSELE